MTGIAGWRINGKGVGSANSAKEKIASGGAGSDSKVIALILVSHSANKGSAKKRPPSRAAHEEPIGKDDVSDVGPVKSTYDDAGGALDVIAARFPRREGSSHVNPRCSQRIHSVEVPPPGSHLRLARMQAAQDFWRGGGFRRSRDVRDLGGVAIMILHLGLLVTWSIEVGDIGHGEDEGCRLVGSEMQ